MSRPKLKMVVVGNTEQTVLTDEKGNIFPIQLCIMIPSFSMVSLLTRDEKGRERRLTVPMLTTGLQVFPTRRKSVLDAHTRIQKEHLGWEAWTQHLSYGSGDSSLKITVEELQNLCWKAINMNYVELASNGTYVVRICLSAYLNREANSVMLPNGKRKWVIHKDSQTEWTIYHPRLMKPIGEVVYDYKKKHGFNYSEKDLDRVITAFEG